MILLMYLKILLEIELKIILSSNNKNKITIFIKIIM